MSAGAAITVYRKELRETLRDKRTLVVMVLLPLVLYPALTVVASEWLISHKAAQDAARSRVILAGAVDQATALVEALRRPEASVDLELKPELRVDERAGTAALAGAEALVVVPASFAAALAAGGSAEVQVFFDGSSDESRQARARVKAAIAEVADMERDRRLAAHGLVAEFIDPMPVEAVSLASRAKVGRTELGKALPFLIVLMVLMGSFYPAIDLTAGEKERGTLESLLATPTPRRAIVAGKFLAVATIAVITGLLNVACMGAAILWIARSAARASGGGLSVAGILANVPLDAVGIGLVALLAAAALFSSLMMAVASLARSFKEAQNFLAPVHFVGTVPAMLAFLPGTRLDYGTALLPVANVTLLFKDAIGGSLALGPAAVALAATGALATLALAAATRIYDSERLLFAPDAGRGRGLRALVADLVRGRRAPKPGDAAPSSTSGETDIQPGEALALFAIVTLLFLFLAGDLQAQGLWGMAASQWLLIAMPVMIFARTKGGIRETLALEPPRGRVLVGALLIGSSAWYLLILVFAIQEHVAPVPPELKRAIEEQLATPAAAQPWVALVALSLSPAICEELLCRGVVARGLRGVLGSGGAAVAAAILFALLHMSGYRFVPQFLLGLSLGVVTLASSSVVPAMIIHAMHNAALLYVAEPALVAVDPQVALPLALAAVAMGHYLVLRPLRIRPAG